MKREKGKKLSPIIFQEKNFHFEYAPDYEEPDLISFAQWSIADPEIRSLGPTMENLKITWGALLAQSVILHTWVPGVHVSSRTPQGGAPKRSSGENAGGEAVGSCDSITYKELK